MHNAYMIYQINFQKKFHLMQKEVHLDFLNRSLNGIRSRSSSDYFIFMSLRAAKKPSYFPNRLGIDLFKIGGNFFSFQPKNIYILSDVYIKLSFIMHIYLSPVLIGFEVKDFYFI